mmetsp:Transcript_87937/g.283949  ORF Transcript_87937/g.283949 Transcript_87937/m.283949 type:complete len:109 (-) Transcript_87937:418-744(-)
MWQNRHVMPFEQPITDGKKTHGLQRPASCFMLPIEVGFPSASKGTIDLNSSNCASSEDGWTLGWRELGGGPSRVCAHHHAQTFRTPSGSRSLCHGAREASEGCWPQHL